MLKVLLTCDPSMLMLVLGGTDTGFYEFEEELRPLRLYVLVGKSSLRAFSVPLSAASLHPDHLFLLDADPEVFMWRGDQVSGVRAQKGRLFGEKLLLQDEDTRKKVVSMPSAVVTLFHDIQS